MLAAEVETKTGLRDVETTVASALRPGSMVGRPMLGTILLPRATPLPGALLCPTLLLLPRSRLLLRALRGSLSILLRALGLLLLRLLSALGLLLLRLLSALGLLLLRLLSALRLLLLRLLRRTRLLLLVLRRLLSPLRLLLRLLGTWLLLLRLLLRRTRLLLLGLRRLLGPLRRAFLLLARVILLISLIALCIYAHHGAETQEDPGRATHSYEFHGRLSPIAGFSTASLTIPAARVVPKEPSLMESRRAPPLAGAFSGRRCVGEMTRRLRQLA